MKRCQKCNEEIPSSIIIDGIKKELSSRKHCLKCVPFGSRTVDRNKIANPSKYGICAHCGAPLNAKGKKNFATVIVSMNTNTKSISENGKLAKFQAPQAKTGLRLPIL